MNKDTPLDSTLYELMINNGYAVNVEHDIDVFVSDFRPHIQKFIKSLLRDGAMACKLSKILNCQIIDLMNQRGFGITKIDQVFEDIVSIQTKYSGEALQPTANKQVGERRVDSQTTFQSEEVLIQTYPTRLLNEVNPELTEILLIDIEQRLELIPTLSDRAYKNIATLDKFIERQVTELKIIVGREPNSDTLLAISRNIYFKLIMYRCGIRNSYGLSDFLIATKRLENFELIKSCLRKVRGSELQLFLFELGETNLIVMDHGELLSRFDLIKCALHKAHDLQPDEVLGKLNLNHLSEKSRQRLHWGLQIAFGSTLEEIGKSAALSRERVRQILTQYFGTSYKDLSSIHNDLERKRSLDTLGKIQLFFESNLEVSLSKLSTELGLTEMEVLHAVPKRLHRFIDKERNTEAQRSDPKLKIIDALRCAQDFEYVLTKDKYENLVRTGYVDGPGWQTVTKAFGTWNKACEAAGVTHTGRSSRILKQYNRQDVIETYSTFMLDKTTTGSISKYEEWSVGRAVASAATIRKWYPVIADLYQACRDHIRTNRLNEYRGYIDTIFNEYVCE